MEEDLTAEVFIFQVKRIARTNIGKQKSLAVFEESISHFSGPKSI